jgi:hypothetical protein
VHQGQKKATAARVGSHAPSRSAVAEGAVMRSTVREDDLTSPRSSCTRQNRRLRDARREAWREAGIIREYWKARLKMESAISSAQSHGLPEGNNHPPYNPDDRWALLANWRQAIAQQFAYSGAGHGGGRLEKGGPSRWPT